MSMDEVEYQIRGEEMQFVEIELDPGEAAVGEAGSTMFMDASIGMDTVFGDGAASQGGLLGKLLGAGKRLITGESLFTTVYTNQVQGKLRVAFAAPYPGKILAMNLRHLGGTLICQKDAFLCAARGVTLGIHFQQKMSVGFFGGEGFIMQRLDGDGLAFIHAGGTILQRELQVGQTLLVDTGCLVALTPSLGACRALGRARAGGSCSARLGRTFVPPEACGEATQRADNDVWHRKSPRPFGFGLFRGVCVVANARRAARHGCALRLASAPKQAERGPDRRAFLRQHRSAAARAKKAHCWAALVPAGCSAVFWEEATMTEISRVRFQP